MAALRAICSAALALAMVLVRLRSLQPPDAQLPPWQCLPAGQRLGRGALPRRWCSGQRGRPQLTALISEALAANTSVRSAQAALQQSRALVDVQTAGTLPRLGASALPSAAGRRAARATASAPGLMPTGSPMYSAACGPVVNASEADARAAQASLADVQVSLVAEVAVNYIELRGLAAAPANCAQQSGQPARNLADCTSGACRPG